ncbi:Undecaprenyl phosphate N N'-diacetylbacillosamine 1-phosphate transferase [termite gut metagenome]|uniref:Undecaprenyl phosphate N N'-diacetylbacillosamine 1-phosphate transferase n=1 Tax=termite gut metagenome TaxID=433724 RepID=A0A5J4QL18_9ZZZZ
MYKSFFKHFFDFLLSFTGFIIISPVFLFISVLLFFVNNGKPFFYQLRPGKNAKIFKIIKFKTMNDKRNANGELLSDSERLTKLGKFIRKASLDEIPQLINVIKGEMSLIGPRPLMPQYLPLYSSEQARRHEVRPGITGWAQCHGRNAISWKQKFEYDVWYVDNLSFKIDIKVILLTLKKIITKEGIYKEGSDIASMVPFDGNN